MLNKKRIITFAKSPLEAKQLAAFLRYQDIPVDYAKAIPASFEYVLITDSKYYNQSRSIINNIRYGDEPGYGFLSFALKDDATPEESFVATQEQLDEIKQLRPMFVSQKVIQDMLKSRGKTIESLKKEYGV